MIFKLSLSDLGQLLVMIARCHHFSFSAFPHKSLGLCPKVYAFKAPIFHSMILFKKIDLKF